MLLRAVKSFPLGKNFHQADHVPAEPGVVQFQQVADHNVGGILGGTIALGIPARYVQLNACVAAAVGHLKLVVVDILRLLELLLALVAVQRPLTQGQIGQSDYWYPGTIYSSSETEILVSKK
eukprot:CAMPEP_0204430176 /NCGR_PEP_ID=MMETSP0470-20130426/61861_1 /ASSEMBLY_ACC=CAM_ASM_000385 /TAXON_ID=2969 /ORGANISM="Oxyrrhis marina" /LENGTH=121 /DNA_ID=CAMNT_0051428265 /DNA_START=604 /DNA_END=969 /DNA_ORIENTATION=-